MTRNGLAITAAVLLVLYSFLNFASGYGQYLKGDLVTGITSAAESTGRSVANMHDRTVGASSRDRNVRQQGDRLRADGAAIKESGKKEATVLYAIAIFILAVAVTELVAAVGVFTARRWAINALILAGIGGIIVEVQDVMEDGMDAWKVALFAVNGIVLMAAFAARKQPTPETTS